MTSVPPYIAKFCKALNVSPRFKKTQAGWDIFYINMKNLRLSLSTFTPLLVIPENQSGDPQEKVFGKISKLIRELGLQERISIALVREYGELLSAGAKERFLPLVAIDQQDLLGRPSLQSVREWFLDRLTRTIPLSRLSPYEKWSPVVGSRFFGRSFEVRKILSDPDTNYAILGIRRIGKTSLLQEVERRINEETEGLQKTIYLTCSDFATSDEFIRRVADELYPRATRRMSMEVFPYFLKRMSRMYKGRITFFLDEFDFLLELDDKIGHRLSHVFKSSTEIGCCRFIVAGFRRLTKEMTEMKSPLFQLMDRVELGKLSKQEVRELVTVPMKNLQITLERPEEMVDTIYNETAGHPNFVQYYCGSLIDNIERTGQRKAGVLDIPDLYTDPMFDNLLFGIFERNTTNLEKKIVYLMARKTDFDIKEIDSQLRRAKQSYSFRDVSDASRNLVTAGVFGREGQDYYFALPILQKFLTRMYDIDYLFQRLLNDEKRTSVV